MKLIFEESAEGRRGSEIPASDVPSAENIPKEFLRDDLDLPEVSEVDVIRHYTALSKLNYGVDDGFYPLGSCTMKYNPKINEDMANLPEFSLLHPLAPEKISQGSLQLIYELQEYLKEITGMAAVTLQPAAGAHGELTGVMMIKAYFKDKEQKRTKMLIPDSAHGTNPASVALCGFEAVQVKSSSTGCIDLNDLKEKMTEEAAGIMLTNPNTLGIFEENILEISKIVHEKGGLCYMDGANLNAMLGMVKPADLGMDAMHINLHKTFSTPHGGGGPGSGPVGVNEKLKDFIPKPVADRKHGKYCLNFSIPKSIGKVRAFYGNFGVMIKAYTYIRALGGDGLKAVAENAVINANYLMSKLKKHFKLPYDGVCQHEFVLSDEGMPNHVTTMDIAKRLLDYGYHAPTIYFPLIVHGAIMIEPTETESKETLDEFAEVMIKIKQEAEKNPELILNAPQNTPVKRVDAVQAARSPVLKWEG